MQNFDFLQQGNGWQALYTHCHKAEILVNQDAADSAISCRRALEYIVNAVYYLKGWREDAELSHDLYQLVTDERFVAFLGHDAYEMQQMLHIVRKTGNIAAHTGAVTTKQAMFALANLHAFITAILFNLGLLDEIPAFRKDLVPTEKQSVLSPVVPAVPQATDEVITANQGKLTTLEPLKHQSDFTEAETRKLYIDLMLQEAGWTVMDKDGDIMPGKACVEIEVHGMPNPSGVGYADYVLFSNSGKPLAVIEAKRTSKDIVVGRQQAKLYADLLEAKFGVRPIIYISNGFETHIIDGYFAERQVMGFHNIDELELLLQRRSRKDIENIKIRENITNRYYQKNAIKAVCERFNTKQMRSLIVMATGTGKTRTAMSLVDVLVRAGWVKNMLFLADRTSLVNQAAKNFKKIMGDDTNYCILSENDPKKDTNARMMFSTYQTMINFIDGKDKPFGIGRFDLIVIDEAHRSVFGKYGSIFAYFDSLLVGLTATPREDVDRSTYELFNHEEGLPTADYSLDEAIADKYLVPMKAISCGTNFTRNGIKYNDLSKKDREQLEAVWEYEAVRKALNNTEDAIRDIKNSELYDYIMNKDTIDKVLTHLMENGQRVDEGETLGKSIIFATSHRHAELIVERFVALYPELAAQNCCQLIDNYVNYSQSLIDEFSVSNNKFRIAVSVDMLDVGIDIPEVLNLVFFKIVKSKIKFWQMVGRGTRLCPEVFGNADKEYFNIFDWCGNLEFFSVPGAGEGGQVSISMTQRLFGLKTEIAAALQQAEYQSDAFAKQWHDDLKYDLYKQVCKLDDTRIAVRQYWGLVTAFKKEDRWLSISPVDVYELKNHVAPLLVNATQDVEAMKFDVLMMQIELSLLDQEVKAGRAQKNVLKIAEALQEKASIPQVLEHMGTIQMVLTPQFWKNQSLDKMEKVRVELRELIKFLEGINGKQFTINIQDTMNASEEITDIIMPKTYKQRVIDYLAEHRDLPILQRIEHIEQLSHADILALERILWNELGTKEEYEKYNIFTGGNVATFIRSMIGIDRKIAVEKFSEFISEVNLNSMQEEYLKSIIDYVCLNGDITPEDIVNSTPFDDYDWSIFGPKMLCVRKYVEHIHQVICA